MYTMNRSYRLATAVHNPLSLFKPEQRNRAVATVLRKLIDRFLILFVVMGTLSTNGSLVRVLQFSWMFQQIIHTIQLIIFYTWEPANPDSKLS